ncbi:SDR family NAD(P)-dependent oxidoreductase [Calderihabitans maritimus]|uniref:Gluconate dehydrogenase n=1 Tax=Calderihabitans maritimus TaxID=1246530 RepID=A0A1Z5HW97_9FIRM|nr:3-oxoacyl-ACP reductase family protein [Calderihabitans maritimus]GAW93809.1 gluconate dehydrogenase [Calderihabitans maritimus]
MFPDKFRLTDQVALVTGARRGIGRAIAKALAEAGADLVLVARSDCSSVAGEIEQVGRKAITITADLTEADAPEKIVEGAVKEYGRLDILVNNAGICPFLAPAEQIRESGWDKIQDVNLKAVFRCCQAASKQMMKQRRGKIINIASVAGIIADPGASAYAISKAGVISLTKNLAFEWGRYNINVNAVAPGFIGAGMNEKIATMPEISNMMKERTALGRAGQPEDVACAVVFLASSAADYITGETLVVDGGFVGYSSVNIASLLGKC